LALNSCYALFRTEIDAALSVVFTEDRKRRSSLSTIAILIEGTGLAAFELKNLFRLEARFQVRNETVKNIKKGH
jgi:hypothetical protein